MQRTALRILLFRNIGDTDTQPFEEAIVRAFQGGKAAGGYLATGDDLGIQLQEFAKAPLESAVEVLASVDHVLILLLIDAKLLTEGTDDLWDWLADAWVRVDASDGRHALICISMEERLGWSFARLRDTLENLQIRPAHEFGEVGVRPAMVALLALHECRELLAAGSGATCLKLFISHAKMDGLPLARSLKHQINEIKWLSKFYDADDIPTGSNWKRMLQQAAGSSLMVMLRTEFYDGRPWCQQEVIWADEYAVPAVLVDARVNLNHPGANLPFDRVPAVRIPDGNLLRILFLALREGLRYLLFVHQVEELKRERLPKNAEVRAFSFAPGIPALLRACKDLTKFGAVPRFILYPDPALRAPLIEVTEALIDKYAPGTILATPKNLAAMGVKP
jgi:hypothetical protein